jgi:hypothetical protein
MAVYTVQPPYAKEKKKTHRWAAPYNMRRPPPLESIRVRARQRHAPCCRRACTFWRGSCSGGSRACAGRTRPWPRAGYLWLAVKHSSPLSCDLWNMWLVQRERRSIRPPTSCEFHWRVEAPLSHADSCRPCVPDMSRVLSSHSPCQAFTPEIRALVTPDSQSASRPLFSVRRRKDPSADPGVQPKPTGPCCPHESPYSASENDATPTTTATSNVQHRYHTQEDEIPFLLNYPAQDRVKVTEKSNWRRMKVMGEIQLKIGTKVMGERKHVI